MFKLRMKNGAKATEKKYCWGERQIKRTKFKEMDDDDWHYMKIFEDCRWKERKEAGNVFHRREVGEKKKLLE